MAFTTIPGVAKLRASILSALITELRPLFAYKTADGTPVNNSTTLVNDTELFLTPAISATYEIAGLIFYSSNSTADIKLAFTFPAGAVLSWAPAGMKFDGTDFQSEFRTSTWQAASGTTNAVAGTSATYDTVNIRGLLRMSTTAGNLQLQMAQNVANVSNTLIKADSFLIARRVA